LPFSSLHHAATAPRSAVAELGVVRRYSAHRMNGRLYPVSPNSSPSAIGSEFSARSLAGATGPCRQSAASSGFGGASERHGFGVRFAITSTQNVTPNHALQRTAPRVTVAAVSSLDPSRTSGALSYVRGLSLRSTSQLPRRAPQSLSLRSLGVATRVVFNDTFLPDLSNFMAAATYPVVAPRSGSRCPARQSVRSVAVQS